MSFQTLDFSYINQNPYFAGISLLMLNFGSRYIMTDLGKFIENVLSHNIVKRFILFCMFFVATRNFLTSLILTIVFSVLIYGLFNDHSKYSLVPNIHRVKHKMKEYYKDKD